MDVNVSRSSGRTELRLRWSAHLVALVIGAGLGWDAGLTMGGTWVGIVMAANAGFFASLAAAAAIDIGVKLRERVASR